MYTILTRHSPRFLETMDKRCECNEQDYTKFVTWSSSLYPPSRYRQDHHSVGVGGAVEPRSKLPSILLQAYSDPNIIDHAFLEPLSV